MWSGCLAGTIAAEEYESILRSCGYRDIQIEIAHVYTKEIIRSEFLGSPAKVEGGMGAIAE